MEQPLLAAAAAAAATHIDVVAPRRAAKSTPSVAKSSSSSSGTNVTVGLALFLVVAAFSLWANYEASKGFEVVVVNAAPHTAAGRRFDLFFVSNGRATRLVLSSSDSVQRALYPDDSFPRKPVERVTLYLAERDLDDTTVAVARVGRGEGKFVVQMSPALMGEGDVQASVASAVRWAMARVWLRDGRGKAPTALLDAMAEYLAVPSGAPASTSTSTPLIEPSDVVVVTNASSTPVNASCWADGGGGGRMGVAQFVRFCDAKQPGFVARLNKAMEEEWSERMLDDALGSSVALFCEAYLSALHHDDATN